MTEYSTTIHGPAADAPSVTDLYAVCRVCGVQWQIRSGNKDDARGCSFCNAPARAISILSEAPTFGGGSIVE